MSACLQKCTLDSLGELVEISKKTFADAFEAANDPEDFRNYLDFAFDTVKLESELTNPNSDFYFVYQNGTLVGYFKLNQNDAQTDVGLPESMELERIYVLEPFQGQGIGEWILEAVKKIALTMGKEFIWLGVWQKNRAAITFYERHGFIKFGTHPYYIGKDKQTDWLMRVALDNLGCV
ncbi:GNAT family N-acetyltransferase [Flavobacteriaceae bacterium TP-CH-4]|uniref:GNAT family N-acetyltransferase n=1 Tax=Pelagihabitans pacificus TaxID=2696054 RepID=A0A967ARW3_9FLAO|nr:GNAT family N-acetyltransferase [Pelagihabitans pacificus]NHF59153.1 GNAT family N-acetyltransferase [Pelagihabitans pacificus]